MTEQLWPGTPLPSVAADEVFSSEKKRNAHNITVRRCTCTYLQNTHTCTRTHTTKHTHTHTHVRRLHTHLARSYQAGCRHRSAGSKTPLALPDREGVGSLWSLPLAFPLCSCCICAGGELMLAMCVHMGLKKQCM